MKPLFETYRPRTWDDVIGQEKTIAKLRAIASRSGLAGRAYWLSGSSGTGKTTIGRLIAMEIADEFNVVELDAATLSPGDLEEIERTMQVYGMGQKTGRAFLINEAHALRKGTIRQLLVLLERIPSHCAIVFTTTCEGEQTLFEDCDDSAPLLSRCINLPLARRDLARPFAERVREIAIAEGLDGGKPIERFVKLLQEHRNNFRAAIQSLESCEFIS